MSTNCFSLGDHLEKIFNALHKAYARIEARLKAEQFKQRVLACFRCWEENALYTTDMLIRLQNIFLGLVKMVSIWDVLLITI